MSETKQIVAYLKNTEINANERLSFVLDLPTTAKEAREKGFDFYVTKQMKEYFFNLVKVKVATNSPLTPILKNIAKIRERASEFKL